MLKTASRVAVVSAAAVVLGLIPLAGTSYAAGCSNAGCDNLGPKATGCEADAVGHGTVDNNDRIAELRWSHKRQAVWVRVTSKLRDPAWYGSYATIEKYDNKSGKLVRALRVNVPKRSGQSDWSNMLGGDYPYRVCEDRLREPCLCDEVHQ